MSAKKCSICGHAMVATSSGFRHCPHCDFWHIPITCRVCMSKTFIDYPGVGPAQRHRA